MIKTREEALRALADGLDVQCDVYGDLNWRSQPGWDWDELRPDIFWRPAHWRIAPPKPIPPGDLTYEEAVELLKAGETIEEHASPWLDGHWVDVIPRCANSLLKDRAYRRKPAPKMVPLGPEDVPPGSVIRDKAWWPNEWLMICDVQPAGICTLRRCDKPNFWTWEFMQRHGEICRAPGQPFTRCEKPEGGR